MTGRGAHLGPFVALVLLLLAFPAGEALAQSGQGAAPAGDAETTRALIDDVLSRSDYQTDLPGAEAEGATLPWRPDGRARKPRRGIPLPAGTATVLELLAWLALGVAVVLAVGALVRGAGKGRRARSTSGAGKTGAEGGAEGAHGVGSGLAELPEAERLAAEGRFGEAVHVLLIRALVRISAGPGRSFADSATSREILRSVGLAPGQRPLLQFLVETVERSLFGGAEVGMEEYERCRRAYDALEGSS